MAEFLNLQLTTAIGISQMTNLIETQKLVAFPFFVEEHIEDNVMHGYVSFLAPLGFPEILWPEYYLPAVEIMLCPNFVEPTQAQGTDITVEKIIK